jgi:hypothetical protein
MTGGCVEIKEWWDEATRRPPPAAREVPWPISLMLPRQIKIHSFTKERLFDPAGGIRGLEMHVQALDSYETSTKAFGKFRFELYTYDPNRSGGRGAQISRWEEDLSEPKKNLLHWSKLNRTYSFKLRWDRAIPVGQEFLIVAVFESPFTERLFAERIFVAGE